MDNVFFGDWDTVQDIERSFKEPGCLEGCEVLYANYWGDGYEGRAEVIYRGPDGKLYEVASSHCSCCGLADSWDPGVVTVESLKMRPNPRHNPKYSELDAHEMAALCLVWGHI
jgi:hypothetical protein